MAEVRGKLVTAWVADTSGLRAGGQQAQGVFRSLGSTIGSTHRQTGLLNQQFRAIGTTLRYAFAGGAVYGLLNLVRGAAELQSSLALITTTADQTGRSLDPLSNHVSELTTGMIRLGVETLNTSQDVAAAMQNIVSSIQGMSAADLTKFTKPILEAATLSQTPTEDLAGLATTMPRVFGAQMFGGRNPGDIKNPKVAERVSTLWDFLIASIPGGTQISPQLIKQMAQMNIPATKAKLTPEQVLAIVGGGIAGGMTAGQTGRSTAFLFNLLGSGGTTKNQRSALEAIGVTPEGTRQQGGLAMLRRMFAAIKAAGGIQGGDAAMAQMRAERASGIENEGLGGLGIKGGGAALIGKLVPQTYAQRALLATYLAWQRNDNTSLDKLLNDLIKVGQDRGYLDRIFMDYRLKQPLKSMAKSIQGMTDLIKSDIANLPFLKPISKGALKAFDWMAGHDTGRHLLEGGAVAAAVSAYFLRGRGIGGGLGRVLGGIPGLGKIFRSGAGRAVGGAAGKGLGALLQGGIPQPVIALLAREAMMTGSTQPGLSPLNPLYVVIAGSLIPGGMFGTGAPGEPIPPGAGIGDVAKKAGRKFRIPPAVAGLGRGLGLLALADVIAIMSVPGDSGAKTNERTRLLKAAFDYIPKHKGQLPNLARVVQDINKNRATKEEGALIDAIVKAPKTPLTQFEQRAQKLLNETGNKEKQRQFDIADAEERKRANRSRREKDQAEIQRLASDPRGQSLLRRGMGGAFDPMQGRVETLPYDPKHPIGFRNMPFRRGVDHPLMTLLAQKSMHGTLNQAGQHFLQRAIRGGPTGIRRAEAKLEDHNQRLMKELTKDRKMQLEGDISITIDFTDENKKDQAKVHVDPSTWQGGKAPSTRGQPKTVKKTVGKKQVSIRVGAKGKQ